MTASPFSRFWQPAGRWLTRKRLLLLAALALGLWQGLPTLALLNDGPALVALARLAPRLGGLGEPLTLLVLVQNEDELRATGGYITAVGTLTVHNGRVSHLDVEDSFAVDDPDLLYPLPPDPLRLYMDAPAWVLRDVNWSADLPSVAPLAEALYTATRPGEFDGVITVDQTALRFLLDGTGPVYIAALGRLVTANNLIEVMRTAREPEPGEGVSYEWWLKRKDFMPQIARAVLKKVIWSSWALVAQSGIRALDERHVQLWLKDEEAAAILAERGWDGALRPGPGDYLMVVETNVGFNKVNAHSQALLAYAVDLADPDAPVGRVLAAYANPAQGSLPCEPGPHYGDGRYATLINRCYWNYLRVYVPDGASLIQAKVNSVPPEWLLLPHAPTGNVEVWPEASTLQSFGTLMVVPFASQQAIEFEYTLAPGSVTTDGDRTTYRLRLQKQPGTQAVPLALRVQLPAGSELVLATPRGQLVGTTWTLNVALQRDTDIMLIYRTP